MVGGALSLQTRDYAEAVQRAREIMERPELQPAQALMAEVERFLKHKYETNRFSKMSAESKGSILKMFAESVKNIPPTKVTTYQCKAFYSDCESSCRCEHGGKLHVYGPLVLQLVQGRKSVPSQPSARCAA